MGATGRKAGSTAATAKAACSVLGLVSNDEAWDFKVCTPDRS